MQFRPAHILIYLLLFASCEQDPECTICPDSNPSVQNEFVELSVEGFPTMKIPEDNPTTTLGIELGRRLFYDPILSGDSTLSCGSCHQQKFSFSDAGNQFSTGIHGTTGNRNTPAILNSGWTALLFWDGRAEGLEEQAFGPVANPVEMDLDWTTATQRVNRSTFYRKAFEDAMGITAIDSTHIVQAIAQFERTIISTDSKFDRWLRDEVELTNEEEAGYQLFFTEKAECFHCHGNIQLTTNEFTNIGLENPYNDNGLFETTGDITHIGKFKIPTLRNVELTGPYMHDGRFETLEDVMDFYGDSIVHHFNIDPLMRPGGFGLTQQEKDQLIAFMKTFTDSSIVTGQQWSNPWD